MLALGNLIGAKPVSTCPALTAGQPADPPPEHGWRLDRVPAAVWVLFADPWMDVSSNEIIHVKYQDCPVNVSGLIVLNCSQLGLMIPTVCPIVSYLNPYLRPWEPDLFQNSEFVRLQNLISAYVVYH